MRSGLVKYYNKKTGYGFIEELQTKAIVYVHAADVEGAIEKNDHVTFDIDGQKILAARHVRKISNSNSGGENIQTPSGFYKC